MKATGTRLSEEETAAVAMAVGTPFYEIVTGLIGAHLERAQDDLCGTTSDRDEHIAIGMLMECRALMEELAGAPMRAEADAKRRAAAKGNPPDASPYG